MPNHGIGINTIQTEKYVENVKCTMSLEPFVHYYLNEKLRKVHQQIGYNTECEHIIAYIHYTSAVHVW